MWRKKTSLAGAASGNVMFPGVFLYNSYFFMNIEALCFIVEVFCIIMSKIYRKIYFREKVSIIRR